jgi:hypothetical protein
MVKAGMFLGLISPVLAVAVVALMLFGLTYGYQAVDSRGNASSGTITILQYALEEGDSAWFFWFGFVVVVCLVAAAGALAGRPAPVWVCAILLWILTVLGMMSIGLFIFPLALLLFISATLLTLAR